MTAKSLLSGEATTNTGRPGRLILPSSLSSFKFKIYSFLSKIDPREDRLVKRVKVGNSGIGLDFFKEYVLVANYDPDSVVLLDRDLNLVKTLKTDSRNVGKEEKEDSSERQWEGSGV